MAKAKEKESVVLTLTRQEAQFLYDIVGWKVSGSWESSRRALGNAIFEALDELPVFGGDPAYPSDMTGSITIEETK